MNRNILLLLSLQSFFLCCSESAHKNIEQSFEKHRRVPEESLESLELKDNTSYLVFLRANSTKEFKIQKGDKEPYEINVETGDVCILSKPCGGPKVEIRKLNKKTYRWTKPVFWENLTPGIMWIKDFHDPVCSAWLLDYEQTDPYKKRLQKAVKHQEMIQEKIEIPLFKKQRQETEKMLNDLVLEDNTAYVFFLPYRLEDKRFKVQIGNDEHEFEVPKNNTYVLSRPYGSKGTYQSFNGKDRKWGYLQHLAKKHFNFIAYYEEKESKYYEKDLKAIQAKIRAFNQAKEEERKKNTTFF